MADLIVNNHAVQPQGLLKIKHGQEQAAMAAAKQNGLDDVFFKIGDDTFVASQAGMKLSGAKAGDRVYLDGQRGTIVGVDRQLNTFLEGFKNPAGAVVGGAGLAWGAWEFVTAIGQWKGLGVAIALAGLAAGVVVNMFPAAFAQFRSKDADALKPFAG